MPLLPWILLLGEHRWSFILAIYATYFLTYALLLVHLVRTRFPEERALSGALACVAIALTPHTFMHILQGYPDIGGATCMLAAIVALEAWLGSGRIRWAIVAGVATAVAVIFRRHYVYAALALYAALLIEALIVGIGRWTSRARPITTLRPARFVRGVLAAGLTSALVVAVVWPELVAQVLNAGPHRFAPWELTLLDTGSDVLDTVGLLPLACACVGWAWLVRQPGPQSAGLRLVLGATPCWVAVWVLHSRQEPYHYPHWMPHFVALGLTFSALASVRLVRLRGRLIALSVVATVGLGAGVYRPAWLSNPGRLPLWPSPYDQLTHPDYDQVLALVRYLRQSAARRDLIVVGASSVLLNDDLLRSADGILAHGPEERLNISLTPQVDTEPAPVEFLLRAEYVVVATPFQYHLRPEVQNVVRAIIEPFTAGWPLAADFELLPSAFTLSQGVQVHVLHRRRESSEETATDTARRVRRLLEDSAIQASDRAELDARTVDRTVD